MTTRSLQVSRTDLSLAPLELWQPGKYVIVDGSFGPGAQTYRRLTVDSPWVAGRFLTNAVADVQMVPLVIQVQSPDEAGLEPNITELLAAFKQFSFTMTSVHHGLGTQAWWCERADYAVGPSGVIDDFDLKFYEQAVSFTIPRSPVNAVGAF